MFEYLKTLPLTDEQKKQITEQGYENAPTLYIMCKATPVAIREWLGLESLDALEAALWEQFSEYDRKQVEAVLLDPSDHDLLNPGRSALE